ncbi:mandelate racemase/muconate lactonizing enzyme family protein [Jannaschia ovalis]|uniref:Mandelate racemase/muconate lactonizing enzyme family protein n=1 Tax=Jannaschia ovalis TaxID=3038773 RepID=A0ABY8LGJ8_9RHOB|nr:mandelate racemase/muconate lactonizing enzyme family protein [Jannaschia sp. GRR-S6-38]WGH79772.1 mandelate racemase/muconate lactonizing enzyme family protein [Jannaschia sp. GRR-S6-38]
MKLADLEIFVVAPPAPGWGGRYWIVPKLTTACGISGYGEVYASAIGPEAMRAVIADVFERNMAGTDPAEIELMSRRVWGSGFTGRPDPTVWGAFAGLEIACWDILGKALDKPVWAITGGRLNDRLRAYTYLYPDDGMGDGFWTSPDLQAQVAADRVAEGWTALKFDPAGPYTIFGGHQPARSDIALSAEMCRAIRAAVGDRADLLFGTHGQFTAAGAIRLARAIAPHDPLWFEEPVPPGDPHALAEVARATHIPVAAGERLCGLSEFATLLRLGGASILQPALGRLGGLSEGRKLAALAQGFGAQIAPHLYCGPVEFAASVQLGTTIPNLLMVEAIESPFHHALGGGPRVEAGFVRAPDAPGLGIAFEEDLARAHPYAGDGLHLEMSEAPCDYAEGNAFTGGVRD